MENEKLRKYDILANELSLIYKCKNVKIIPYVLTWDGVVTKFHKHYVKELGISTNVEAYIQYLTIKKTLELISLERRRSILDVWDGEDIVERSIEKLCEKQCLDALEVNQTS